jgi:hypothetical protein
VLSYAHARLALLGGADEGVRPYTNKWCFSGLTLLSFYL